MAYHGEDDFEYWMKLTNYGTDRRVIAIVTEIEKELGAFTGRLTEEDMGFRCTSYHIFPFDTRTIATVIGNHTRSQYSFSISLEDIDINLGEEGNIIIPTVRVYRWKGTCDDPNRDEFNEIMRKELQAVIKPYELIKVLRDIYNEIAERHGLPLLNRLY